MVPRLTVSEACHRLALSEGQKEKINGGEKMQKKIPVIGVFLIAILLSSFLLTKQNATGETVYQDVSVKEARKIIENQSNVVIFDVRNHSEYDLGHLYAAILLPTFLLENGSIPIQDYINNKIIVYCKAGSRSTEACQILVEQGFTEVYNMIGGITAWMEAKYPIYTSYHNVTADFEDNDVNIEPLLLYQDSCASCQSQACSGNCASANTNVTVLEESENSQVVLIVEEVNGTTVESIFNNTILWRYVENESEFNRTITFSSIAITANEITIQLFRLQDRVQHKDYNLTLTTPLVPLDSQTYNSSYTVLNYAPVGKTTIQSLENVFFNKSATLSQLYATLAKVAKELGKDYAKSEDNSLTVFAERYYNMASEAKLLSGIVKNQLQEYDKNIINSAAIIMDDWLYCKLCETGCQFAVFASCYAVCSCLGGWACTFCYAASQIPYAPWWGCYSVCHYVLDCEGTGGTPAYHYVEDQYVFVDGGTCMNPQYIEGSSNDGNYAYMFCGGYGDMVQIIGTVEQEGTHGGISIYGHTYPGIPSDLYVYTSYDGNNWNFAGSTTVGNIYSNWIDFDYVTECFNYIAIVGYNSGDVVALWLDSVRITP
jgi:phage shock protein E